MHLNLLEVIKEMILHLAIDDDEQIELCAAPLTLQVSILDAPSTYRKSKINDQACCLHDRSCFFLET
jgi:hypothetical protein